MVCRMLLTMACYEWVEEWAGIHMKNRGTGYQHCKMEVAYQLLDMAMERFPQLQDKV